MTKLLAKHPTFADCKPGLWVQLANGWVVGPIIESKLPPSVYVRFGDGVWRLDLADENPETPIRLIKKVGTREELTKISMTN